MKKNRFTPILILILITVITLGIYWQKTDTKKKVSNGNAASQIEMVNFLDYSITLPDGWHAETSQEVTSKFYKNDPIFGDKCITSKEELKTIKYEAKPCHFVTIIGDDNSDKVIMITDTENITLGGGGGITTTTSDETFETTSQPTLKGKFKFVYEGPKDNTLGLYYATGCFNTNLCIHTVVGVSYDEFKKFLKEIAIK